MGGIAGNGNMSFESKNFPSESFIKEHIKKKYKVDNVVITNIFEFKSKEDFLLFIKE